MTCYISNRVYLRPRTHKTPYEIWKGKKPNLKHFHEFRSTYYILKDREPRGKFFAKSDEEVFLGYSSNSRAYKLYIRRTMSIIESINLQIDDYLPLRDYSISEDPPSSTPSKEGNTLTDLQEVPTLDGGDSCSVSIEVYTTPRTKRSAIESI